MKNIYLCCRDFPYADGSGYPGCCDSCHEDEGMGYDMLEYWPDGKTGVLAHVCCAIPNDPDYEKIGNWSRDDWAKHLWKFRDIYRRYHKS